MSARLCPLCDRPLRPGRHGVHDRGECQAPSYRARYAVIKPMGRPRIVRPPERDLSPAQIERIMQRRAVEQKYERAMQG